MIKSRYQWISKNGKSIFSDSVEDTVSFLLTNRNLGDDQEYESSFHDPYLLPDFSRAIERVFAARDKGEIVAIYGDYDVDGVTSTAILFETLNILGIKVEAFLPHREDDGYGISSDALRKINKKTSLLITVDNGTSAHSAVAKAVESGVDVIVIDHHSVQGQLPQALVVNPHREDNKYPFIELSAAGLAFKFAQAVFQRIGREGEEKWLLDLAALGTLADRVLMRDENRAIARFGLRVVQVTRRVGLIALMARSGLTRSKSDAEELTFKIIPRLNAAGRMEHPDLAFRLLTTKDTKEAEELAQKLDQLNSARKKITDKAVFDIKEKLVRAMPLPEIICVAGDWPAGILGILAGKIADDLGRPAAAISVGEENCTGSIRGNGVVNIVDVLQGFSSVFSKFGGHHEAGGFSFPLGSLGKVEEYFSKISFSNETVVPSLEYDLSVSPRIVGQKLVKGLGVLEPHGEGNDKPVFQLHNMRVEDLRMMGATKEHVRMSLSHELLPYGNMTAVAFRWKDRQLPELGTFVDVVGEFRVNDFNGSIDLHLKDIRTAVEEEAKVMENLLVRNN